MKMFAKTVRSAFAFVLVAALMLGVCSSPIALAAGDFGGKTEINYVSIGDSMTNGYGFEGYKQDSNDINVYDFIAGKNVYGEGSYALQFEEYLKGKGYDVNHTKLAPSALLTYDLLYLLDGCEEVEDGWNGYKDYVGNTYTDAELKEHFQNAITEADIITMCIGNASFGAYLVQKVTDTIGIMGSAPDVDPNLTLENGLALLEDEETKQIVLDIYNDMKNELSAYTEVVPANIDVDAVLDVVAFTVASFLVSYEALVDKIIEMNPDVEIILIGLMNTTYGMTVCGEGFEFPFGDMMDNAFEALNNYIAGVPAAKQLAGEYAEAKFYYADQPAPEFIVQAFDDLAANNWENIDGGRLSGQIVRQRNIDAYNNALRYAIGSALGFALPAVSLADVANYEAVNDVNDSYKIVAEFKAQAAQYNGANLDFLPLVARYIAATSNYDLSQAAAKAGEVFKAEIEKEISIAIYLAIEEAVVANVDTMDITVDGLMGIAGDIFGALGVMPEALNPANNPGPVTIKTALVNWFNGTENGRAMCKVYALFKVGNGMSVHPTPTGHDNIYKAVVEAYEGEYTATMKVVDTVVYLVTEYYDDAYAFGYEYALENGYVDAVVDALDAAIAAVEAAELDTLGLTAELEAEVAAELAEVVEALEAAKALVVEADVLDEATLNALVAALEEANDALAQVNAVLAQAGADVNNLVILPAIEAAQEYVETVVIPAVEKAVDEAIEAAKEAAKIAAEKAYEYLVEALGDAYDYLVEAIVDAVVTYMPVVDEMLYDYFYNNPEEVIEFVKTYGPYLVPVVEEYGDEALALVGYVLYTYGEDMAAYVIENSDEILAGFEAWADKYGERTAEMLQVYAETLGLCDAVREQIAELEAALEELEAELEKVTGEAKAAIEAEIAKIEAAIEELNAKVEAVIDALNDAVADANAKVEDVIADIEAAIEDLKASVEELKAAVESLVNETLAAIREEIFAANRAVLEEVKALAEDILNKQIENLEDLVEALEEAAVAAAKEIKAIIDELVYEATHGEYVIENDSFYVALGDSSAVSESYVDALAAVLGVDYANLAKAGDTTTETLALIAEQAEIIAKADLVTVGYTANIFTAEVTYTMQNILMGDPVEVYDWVALVGENGAEYVEKALAEVRAKLVEEGLDIEVSGRNVADMLMACVEAYAYTYVAHVLTYPEIVNAIHEVAPEALVVIVGLHNTVENIVIDIEGTEIALGDYVQYAVDAANVISLVNAILVEDTVFVATPDVETLKEEKGDELTYDMISFVFEAILTNGADFATSEAGHAYITEQILNALTIIDNRTGLLGDADSDGDVDNVDAMLVLQYDAALIGENDLDLTVCDVNGDGLVDNVDAMLILQYDALLIEVFPVEE